MSGNRDDFAGNNTAEEKKKNEISKLNTAFIKLLTDPKNSLAWIKEVASVNVHKSYQGKYFSFRNHAVNLAVQYNRIDILAWLVNEMECPVNIRPLEQHPVIVAIRHAQEESLEWLLEKNAADSIQGYCVEACIYYNNLAAFKCLLNDDEFPISLAKKSFVKLAGAEILLNENVTTLMMKFNRFDMLLWLLTNYEYVFKDDIKDTKVNVLPRFHQYLQILDISKLTNLRNHLNRAFDVLDMSADGDAIKMIDAIDVATAIAEHNGKQGKLVSSTPPTPSWVPLNPFATGSSPKKQSSLNSPLLWAKVSSLSDELNALPDEYDVVINTSIVIPASKKASAQTVSPISTSPKKLAYFNSQDFWSKISSLKNDDVLEVSENLEAGTYKQ